MTFHTHSKKNYSRNETKKKKEKAKKKYTIHTYVFRYCNENDKNNNLTISEQKKKAIVTPSCNLSAAGNGRLSLTNLRFQVLLSRWASPCTSWVSARYPKWKWYYTSRSYSVINAENRLLIISIVRLKHPPPHLPEQPLLFLVPVYLKRRLPSIVTATIFHVHIPTHDAQIHETNKQPRIWIRTHRHRIKGIALWNVTRNNGHTNAHSQTLTLDACTRTGMHRFSLKLSVFRFLVAGITFTKRFDHTLCSHLSFTCSCNLEILRWFETARNIPANIERRRSSRASKF